MGETSVVSIRPDSKVGDDRKNHEGSTGLYSLGIRRRWTPPCLIRHPFCGRRAAGTTPLKPAEPLNLADLPLNLAGYPFKFPFGSQRTIRTYTPSDLPERTAYSVEDSSCLELGAEFHD